MAKGKLKMPDFYGERQNRRPAVDVHNPQPSVSHWNGNTKTPVGENADHPISGPAVSFNVIGGLVNDNLPNP